MKNLKLFGILMAAPWLYLWDCILGWRPFQSSSGHMAGLGEGLLSLGFICALFLGIVQLGLIAGIVILFL